jgi:4'-phosphopantetheinyl transferase EntD
MVSGSWLDDNSPMSWRELTPLATTVASHIRDLPDVCLVAAPVGDHCDRLLPEERAGVAGYAHRRAAEFSTGRHLAHCALEDLGKPGFAIPRGADRAPCWPAGVVGSITHGSDWAVAGVALASRIRGLGIDLEGHGRVRERLYPQLFTDRELAMLRRADPRQAGLMFSAKESGYKAVHPLVGEFIPFQAAEVDVDWSSSTFRLRYVGDHAANGIMDAGTGRFCFFERYVFTLFMIR